MQNDPNSQKKGSKRPLNDSSTPPLSPMDEAAARQQLLTYLETMEAPFGRAKLQDMMSISYRIRHKWISI